MKWSVELQSSPSAPSEARAAISERLDGRVTDDVLGDVLIVVSELVTNSVRHGPGRPISVSAFPDNRFRVVGEVVDGGEGTVAIRAAGVDEFGRHGGMGLPIVDALAKEWGVYEGSTHVWFVIER